MLDSRKTQPDHIAMVERPSAGFPTHRKQQILLGVAALLPISRCCMYDISEDLLATGHVVHNGETRWINPYHSHYQMIDPFSPRRLLAARGRHIYGTGAADALQSLQKTDYYQGFMKPMGQVHKVDMLLAGPFRVPFVGLRLSRTARLGPFTSSERTMLDRLMGLLNLAVEPAANTHDIITGLTPREREIVSMLVRGHTNKEIGLALNVQLPTVKTHLANIFRKLGARNRAELVARVLA